jgi:hypothetical protein
MSLGAFGKAALGVSARYALRPAPWVNHEVKLKYALIWLRLEPMARSIPETQFGK